MKTPEEQRRFAQTRMVTSAPSDGSGYRALVLERLAKQVCRIAGVEWSCIFVRDRRDPRAVIAAAGYGIPWDMVGERFATDEGAIGRVLTAGRPMLVPGNADLPGSLDTAPPRG